MKKQFKLSPPLALAVMVIISLSFSRCKKTPPPTPAPTTAPLILHLHTDLDTNEINTYRVNYKIAPGRKINPYWMQTYISKIQLVKLDGSIVDVPGTVLKSVATEEYKMGNIPVGNYKTIQFYVGLDATTDVATPSSGDTVLNNSKNLMLYNSSSVAQGHIFVNFQGYIDTSTVPSATATMQPFMYYLGTSANYRQVIMPEKDFTVTPNTTQFIHINVNYAKLLNGVALNKSGNLMIMTPTDNNSTLGKLIGNNITSMFSYEQ